jgi:hypothetical protein
MLTKSVSVHTEATQAALKTFNDELERQKTLKKKKQKELNKVRKEWELFEADAQKLAEFKAVSYFLLLSDSHLTYCVI